jgi:NADP-dependent 3-hydroxy acid dehydrogenase YdfG
MGKLEGKIALVTGGSSGIGLATAKQFVNEGAHVFITGRRDAELAAAAKEIGRNVTAAQGDVSNHGDLDRLFAQIHREKSKLDVVFANAGLAKYSPLEKITEEFYDSIFDINVKGLLFTVQKALPLLPDGASIILNSSVVGSKGLSGNSVYAATKAALRSFARTWTTDLKNRRIRVRHLGGRKKQYPSLAASSRRYLPHQVVSTRVEHEYFREGAWTYLAAWDVHRAKVFGRCEKKTGIAPVDRLIGEVMSREPYQSARRVFWIMDNCSAHRGQKAVDRLRSPWPKVLLVHTPIHASWLNQIEIYRRTLLTPTLALKGTLVPPL